MLRGVIWNLFLEIWAKVEKLSEIKPHLAKTQMRKNKNEPFKMISTHSLLHTYKSVLHWPVLWGNQPQLYSLQTKHWHGRNLLNCADCTVVVYLCPPCQTFSHDMKRHLLKVALSQKILENFYVANINIPNHYPEQKIQISCLKQ